MPLYLCARDSPQSELIHAPKSSWTACPRVLLFFLFSSPLLFNVYLCSHPFTFTHTLNHHMNVSPSLSHSLLLALCFISLPKSLCECGSAANLALFHAFCSPVFVSEWKMSHSVAIIATTAGECCAFYTIECYRTEGQHKWTNTGKVDKWIKRNYWRIGHFAGCTFNNMQ